MSNEHVDVLIVGAGISGIGAAYWLQQQCPDRSFTIFEGRDAIGGTWDLFRYPGIRSDSDMQTMGFSFKPWTNPKSIAPGPDILDYLHETVDEFDIRRHINFGHQVTAAEWSSDDGRWTVQAEVGADRMAVTQTCTFLFMCSGYYSYEGGYRPEFPGQENFTGPIIHPQQWPEDLDYRDKKVVVIGSGATAATLIPSMAPDTSHITMLQRTPTWMVAAPAVNPVAKKLHQVLPEGPAHRIARKVNAWRGEWFYNMTRTKPEKVRDKLLGMTRAAIGDEQTEAHFTPDYDPWDQRLCLLPNGDLYDALNDGSASVVTDHIDHFTESGIQLQSGDHLDADIIVSATGLNLVTAGGVAFTVDDQPVDFSETWTYRGVSVSGVPNMATTFGYINASWTLRADLVSQFVCRLLNHMRDTGTTFFTPTLRPSDRAMTPRLFIDGFPAGYMARGLPAWPKQGDREPWTNPQRYSIDRNLLMKAPFDDGALVFTTVRELASAAPVS